MPLPVIDDASQQAEIYEVYALRYARHAGRSAADNAIGGDPHSGERPIDYFIWVIRSSARTVVIDLGFDAAEAAKRGRIFFENPGELLRRIDIDPAMVSDVIITHLHYDHAGNQAIFPRARFHLQEEEMRFATGRAMNHAFLRHPFDGEQVAGMVRRLFDGRVVFHTGFASLAPGIELHLIGGHSAGLQVVRVRTKMGWLVLASDAAHLYENLAGRPFPIVVDVLGMLEGHNILRRLASNDDLIIPGHDPLVMARFPAPFPELEGRIVRLDQGPIQRPVAPS